MTDSVADTPGFDSARLTLAEGLEEGDAGPFLAMIQEAESYFEAWQDHCDNIDKEYADLDALGTGGTDREFQMFWANLEVLKPTVYARTPKPLVRPRYGRRKALPRAAAEIVQRATEVTLEKVRFHDTMKLVRDDLLLPGRGVPWCRFEQEPDAVSIEHLDRRDFLHEPARCWAEVGWAGRRTWMTDDEGEARFGEVWLEIGGNLVDSARPGYDDQDGEDYNFNPRRAVWELWMKDLGLVVWVAEDCTVILDQSEPPLDLQGFFPCPKPAFTTTERGTLKPVPDMVYYKDQLEEINELTSRAHALSEAIKAAGFYPGGAEEIGQAIERLMSSADNRAQMVPVSNFAALGGTALRDSIVWLPIEEIANTIRILFEMRRAVIQDVYEITGLSDIMRGATEAEETLGAQQLKAQYGSTRAQQRKETLVELARDTIMIVAEIIAENFSPEALLEASQVDDLPSEEDLNGQIEAIAAQGDEAARDPRFQQAAQQNPQIVQQLQAKVQAQIDQVQQTVTVERVVSLLREQRLRPFVLEVETDSTIQPDEQAEKMRRTEFLTAMGSFIQQAGPMVQQMPQTGGFIAEALKFAAGGFRAGREMDDAIDDLAEMLKSLPTQQQEGPSPEEMEAQLKQQEAQAKAKTEMERLGLDREKQQADIADKQEARRLDGRRVEIEDERLELDRDRFHFDMSNSAAEMQREDETRAVDMEREDRDASQRDDSAAVVNESISRVMEGQEETMEILRELMDAVKAPKRVIRDEQGNIAGIEPVSAGGEEGGGDD